MPYEYLHGVETEIQKLRDFPAKVEGNVIRGAVRAAASYMRKAILPYVPRVTGALAKTLRVSSGMKKGVAKAAIKVGDAKKGVFYADMVLGGTKPHLIRGRKPEGGGLAFGGLVRRSVQHPGAKPKPFLDEGNATARDGSFAAAFQYADERVKQLLEDQGNAG